MTLGFALFAQSHLLAFWYSFSHQKLKQKQPVNSSKAIAKPSRRDQEGAHPSRDLIPGIRHLRPMDALRIYLGIALVIKGVYFIMNMAELEAAVNLTNIRLAPMLLRLPVRLRWGKR